MTDRQETRRVEGYVKLLSQFAAVLTWPDNEEPGRAQVQLLYPGEFPRTLDKAGMAVEVVEYDDGQLEIQWLELQVIMQPPPKH